MNMNDKWNKTVPVEKSSYLCDDEIIYTGLDTFRHDSGKPVMLDLFCGAGGFSVGCSWAGFEAVLGVDHLEPAVKTWAYNHPNAISCLGDMTKINPNHIKDILASKGIEKINLITGGVPCQGFSNANRKHTDNDKRNYLFYEYMKFVEVFQPDYIILENVSGMRNTAGGKFEKNIRNNMIKLGYTPSVKLVNAADYGVPQLRQRLLFIGVKDGIGLKSPYVFPKGEYVGKHRTVADAISDLPELGNNETADRYTSAPVTDYQKLMRGIGSIKAIKKPKCLANHTAPNHSPETVRRIDSTVPGQPMYQKFRQRVRLKYDAPSPTQLAGGIRPQFQFGHPVQTRGLTVRERARIQSFPDSYIFTGGTVQERVQTGNAVPPLLIYNLVKPIAEDISENEKNRKI